MQYDLQQYIGIPFLDHGRDRSGCDCWGLVRLVYAEQLGIILPDLGDEYSEAYARGEVDEAVGSTVGQEWNVDVTGQAWQPLDVMIFTRAGVECHVGLYVRPGEMLHVIEGTAAAYERYDTVKWKRRLSRVVRWRDVEN
jgi:probable lipoprotein NlpC